MTEETKDFEALYLEAKARIRQLERQADTHADQMVDKNKELTALTETAREYKADLSKVRDEFEAHKRLATAAVVKADEALVRERKSREEEVLWAKSEAQQAHADVIFERDELLITVDQLRKDLAHAGGSGTTDSDIVIESLKTDKQRMQEQNERLKHNLDRIEGILLKMREHAESRL